jgi:2',3'-cyclic-nucleotide 2'-phosphodiesterase (5'-nucleotidase family)
MSPVIGNCAVELQRGRPEGTLSNFASDMLREASVAYLGKPADMALMNIGGLRADLNAGPITVGEIYEIFPFMNTFCIVYLKGTYLKELMAEIAKAGGEGVSNAVIRGTKADRKLLSATVGGKPIDDNRIYTVATIDFLAEGNDGMLALLKAEKVDRLDNVTVRDLFLKHIRQLTKAGKAVTANTDKRIFVE